MKKFFLFIAVIAAITLTSCGGGETASVPDGNSQATMVDPNDPNQAVPQMSTEAEQTSATSAEQATPEAQTSTAEQSNPANQ